MTNAINNTTVQSNKRIIIKSNDEDDILLEPFCTKSFEVVPTLVISSCLCLEFVLEEDFFHKERILFSRYIDIRTAIITARI